MKLKDIEALASMKNSDIMLCDVIEHNDNSITFLVDKGLTQPTEHLELSSYIDIVDKFIDKEQIDDKLIDLVKCSFEKDKLSYLGKDALYKCFVTCYAEHRPLILTPDVIWLIICQSLTEHIFKNAEKFKKKIVYHKDKLDIEVKTKYDIHDDKCDWGKILETFYSKIENNTKNGIAKKLVAEYSTTSDNERISSIATLMHGIDSYFKYYIRHIICGIPHITLKGNKKDWELLLKKASILKEFGLGNWYKWLEPILKEFVRTASGKPHLNFWKNIVQIAREEDFSTGRGCAPDFHDVNGWCVALFNHRDYYTDKPAYEKCSNRTSMKSEIVRVGFKYIVETPDRETITPMELWCGIIGVEEDKKTYALTPKIGWFVRGSHEHEENIARLKGANDYRGISLTVDEVPVILNELDNFNELSLQFNDKIKLPNWLFKKSIKKLILKGKIDEEYSEFIKKHFDSVFINEDDKYEDYE